MIFDDIWGKQLLNFLLSHNGTRAGVRGRQCAASGAVIEFSGFPDQLQFVAARVVGGAAEPYEVVLEAAKSGITTECSCPVGYDCKHTHAAALALGYGALFNESRFSAQFERFMPETWCNESDDNPPDPGLFEPLAYLFEVPAGSDRAATAPAEPSKRGKKLVSTIEPTPVKTPWWENFLNAKDSNERFEILLGAIRRRIPKLHYMWQVDSELKAMASGMPPELALAAFETELEKISRLIQLPLVTGDSGLAEFVGKLDLAAVADRHSRAVAEERLAKWLAPSAAQHVQSPGPATTIEVVWSGRERRAETPPVLCFQVLASTSRMCREPRTPNQISQILNDCNLQKRRIPEEQLRFLRWWNASPTSGIIYSGGTSDARDEHWIPVGDLIGWLTLWCSSLGVVWSDGAPVSFDFTPASVAINADGERPRWVVKLPVHGSDRPRVVEFGDVQIMTMPDPSSRAANTLPCFVREIGGPLRPLDTPGLNAETLWAISRCPELPVEMLRERGLGGALVARLSAHGDAGAESLAQPVAVKITVELTCDGANGISVSARAEGEGGVEFHRVGRAAWLPAQTIAVAPDPSGAVRTADSVEELQAEDGAFQVGDGDDAPIPAKPHPLAFVPRHTDIAPVEEWLEGLIPPLVEPQSGSGSAASFTWKLDKASTARLVEQWQRRPARARFMGNKAFASLVLPRRLGKIRVKTEPAGIDWLRVSVEMEQEMARLSPREVAAALAETGGGRVICLPGQRLYYRDELEEYARQVSALTEVGLAVLPGDQRLHAMQMAGAGRAALATLDGAGEQFRALAAELRTVLRDFAGVPVASVAPDVASYLRPYQRAGADFLCWAGRTFGGALLADDMGLGKTLQLLAALTALRADGQPQLPSLVICPASVAHNWQREAAKFAPSLRVVVIERGIGRRKIIDSAHEHDILVLNYALARRDLEMLKAQPWLAVVVDEAQAIKNAGAAIAKAVKELDARFRYALTGTPIENRIEDLWSILDFAAPGYLGPTERFGERLKENPEWAHRLLRARLRPVLMRRLKTEVAPELPDRIEERKDCEMPAAQRTAYMAELKRTRDLLSGIGGKVAGRGRIQILAALMRLREICCDPALLGLPDKGSGKVNELMDLLPPLLEAGHKVLLFSQFVRMLHRLEAKLHAAAIPTRMLTGKTTHRQELVDEFEGDPEPSVFLISLKAGGVGLNLTSASHVVLFDPWWNPAVEAQAIDRTHRIGQDKTVVAFRLVTNDTIEERILDLQEKKLGIVRNVLEEDTFNRSLTREDFEFLLGGAPAG